MGEQSGCDPQAAVRARTQKRIDSHLKAVLVDGSRVTYSPVTGEVSINSDLSDEEFERLRETWFKVDPRIRVVITEPMQYFPTDDGNAGSFGFTMQRDPGDETAA